MKVKDDYETGQPIVDIVDIFPPLPAPELDEDYDMKWSVAFDADFPNMVESMQRRFATMDDE